MKDLGLAIVMKFVVSALCFGMGVIYGRLYPMVADRDLTFWMFMLFTFFWLFFSILDLILCDRD